MLSCKPPCRLIRKNLADCLKGIGKHTGVLTVLKPLLLSGGKKDRAKLPELVPQWEEEIRSAELPEHGLPLCFLRQTRIGIQEIKT
jgi:hypothetical protein